VKDPVTKEPLDDGSNEIRRLARERGVIFGKGGPTTNLIKIKPPLIVRQEECDEILGVLGGVLKDLLRK
jgi:4-aminobutyrate aminotransferase-like enzyme